jgi:hypothetical protein
LLEAEAISEEKSEANAEDRSSPRDESKFR